MGCILQSPNSTNGSGFVYSYKAGRALAIRAIRVSDCEIRSIPFDWPIRCNVRWKSLVPRQNRSLPIFVVPRAMQGERDIEIRCVRTDKWVPTFGKLSGDSVLWLQLCLRAYPRYLRSISVLWDTNYFCRFISFHSHLTWRNFWIVKRSILSLFLLFFNYHFSNVIICFYRRKSLENLIFGLKYI